MLYLLDNERITRKGIMNLLKVHKTKAFDILTDLVMKGLIIRKGNGRGTYYTLMK